MSTEQDQALAARGNQAGWLVSLENVKAWVEAHRYAILTLLICLVVFWYFPQVRNLNCRSFT